MASSIHGFTTMYSWACEANYKIIDQPIRERVTASHKCIQQASPEQGLKKASMLVRECAMCINPCINPCTINPCTINQ